MSLPEKYPGQGSSLLTFADRWEAITPTDGVSLPKKYKYVFAGAVGGSVSCVDEAGTTSTLYVNAGDVLKCRPTQIRATGTTGGITLFGAFHSADV